MCSDCSIRVYEPSCVVTVLLEYGTDKTSNVLN